MNKNHDPFPVTIGAVYRFVEAGGKKTNRYAILEFGDLRKDSYRRL